MFFIYACEDEKIPVDDDDPIIVDPDPDPEPDDPDDPAVLVQVGIPVTIGENRGQMAIEIDGKPHVAAFLYDKVGDDPRVSLLIIDALTGKTDQYWYPRKDFANGTMYHMLRGSNGCIYTTIGNQVLEFNVESRSWTGRQPINGYAMSFTEGPDGKIYFGTYPLSNLYEFDPVTKNLKMLVRLDPQEQYPHYLAVDDHGWIYAGIGTARGNMVAFNLETKERVQLSVESERQTGYARVFRGTDGKVYGVEPKNQSRYYRLENGKATPVSGTPAVAPRNNTHFNTHWVNAFPSGGEIVECNMSSKKLQIKDKNNATKEVAFTYEANGSAISSLVAGTDNKLYGSTNHPMHLFKYDPESGQFTDYTYITAVGGGNFPNLAAWNNKIAGGSYPDGRVYVFDPSLPWTYGDGANPNPKLIGTYGDIYRPRMALLLNDNETLVMGGHSGYGSVGGGLVFYNLATNQSTLLPKSEFFEGHSPVSMRQLENGNLVGGTSTLAPGGGDRTAFTSIFYEMDPGTRQILFQTNIGPDISNIEVTSDSKVLGLTTGAQLFVYDPGEKKIISRVQQSGGITFNTGQSLIKDKDGTIYMVLDKSISVIDENNKAVKLADLPSPAAAGLAIIDNVLYYADGTTLWKYQLPTKDKTPE